MTAQPCGQGNALLARISMGIVGVDAAGEHVRTVGRASPGGTDPGAVTALGDPALDAVPAAPAALPPAWPRPGPSRSTPALTATIGTPWASSWSRWRMAGSASPWGGTRARGNSAHP